MIHLHRCTSCFAIVTASDQVLDSVKTIWHDFLEHLPLIVAGILVFLVTWLLSWLVRWMSTRALARARLRKSFKILCIQFASLTVWLIGLLIAAVVVFPGVTPAKILAVLGLGSIALGLAFKDIFENFFAGVLILWRFPFDPGDFIQCQGIEGQVEEIRIRMTLIRRTDGTLIIVPNARLFKEPVDVLTSWKVRRVTIIAGVAYREDVHEAREVIQQAVEGCRSVDRRKPVEIFAQELASSGVNFEVSWWTAPTPTEVRRSRDEVVAAVKTALDRAGIEIPFPYRTLTFSEPLEIARQSQDAD